MEDAGLTALVESLATLVGAKHVSHGPALAAFSSDVFATAAPPRAAVAPGTVEELQAVLRLAAEHRLVTVPRGGGSSYSSGFLADRDDALLIDLRRLDRFVELNEADAFVTVEAGITWAALDLALAAKGWRTPFRGPFSGLVASVGGTLAHHAISHGSGAFGMSGDSLLSLDVLLPDGRLLRTGSAALTGHPFLRHAGPDLAGLFLGACGAFGLIVRATLPLRRRAPAFVGVCFGFEDFEALHAGMRAAALEAVDDTHFALDAAMMRSALARPVTLAERWRIAKKVSADAPHPGAALWTLARLATTRQAALGRPAFQVNYGVEGGSSREARDRASRLRAALRPFGHELPPTVPTVMHHQPFEKMFNLLGPRGERWVPLHGILPHSRVVAFQRDFEAWRTQTAEAFAQRGAWLGCLFECIGLGAFSFEVCLYWPDALNAYHHASLAAPPRTTHADNPALRDWIGVQRHDLIALLQLHGAVQMQLGRTYSHLQRLDPVAAQVLQSLKHTLDPGHTANPGVLGL